WLKLSRNTSTPAMKRARITSSVELDGPSVATILALRFLRMGSLRCKSVQFIPHPAQYRLMAYQVREVFYTLQGEGAQWGRPAVFCRFAGCNLWSGREQDRASAVCRFCDTQFVGTDGPGGGRFESAQALAERIESFWPTVELRHRFTVLTGGGPLLQADAELTAELHRRGFQIAVETNGTQRAPNGLDW